MLGALFEGSVAAQVSSQHTGFKPSANRYPRLELLVLKINLFHYVYTYIVLKPMHQVLSSPYCLYRNPVAASL